MLHDYVYPIGICLLIAGVVWAFACAAEGIQILYEKWRGGKK